MVRKIYKIYWSTFARIGIDTYITTIITIGKNTIGTIGTDPN